MSSTQSSSLLLSSAQTANLKSLGFKMGNDIGKIDIVELFSYVAIK